MENDGEAIDEGQPVAGEPAAEEPAARPRRRGGLAIGAFLGLLTGAGLATLFTPFSGQEVRQRTAEKAPDLWRRRDELARGAAATARSRLDEAVAAGREAAREAQEESRRRFEKLTGRKPGGGH